MVDVVERSSVRTASGTGPRLKQVREALAHIEEGGGADVGRKDGWFGRTLHSALEGLGPVFRSFGEYLGTRPDLLPLPDCRELGRAAEESPTPLAAVRARVEEVFGRSTGQLFSALEDVPFRCDAVFQWHGAWLADERPVVVKVLRPEWERHWATDGPLLLLLGKALGAAAGEEGAAGEVFEEFGEYVRLRADLTAEAEALRSLAEDGDEVAPLRVPGVVRSHCREKILTFERLGGETVGRLFVDETPLGVAGGRAREEVARERVAREFCQFWLRQALRGGRFPLEVRPGDVALLPDGTLALLGGVFARLPASGAESLVEYMVAAAAGDADAACAALLREMG